MRDAPCISLLHCRTGRAKGEHPARVMIGANRATGTRMGVCQHWT